MDGKEVLELGCGTGLASILCCKMGAKRVIMTDYQSKVLANAEYNCQQNGCQQVVIPMPLDWNVGKAARYVWKKYAKADEAWNRETIQSQFELIIAGDIVYDAQHGEMHSILIEALLAQGGTFHVVLPGTAYRSGIEEFELAMEQRFKMDKRRVYRKADGTVTHTYYIFAHGCGTM